MIFQFATAGLFHQLESGLRRRPRIAVAVSGGVDSAVTAILMKHFSPNHVVKRCGNDSPGLRGEEGTSLDIPKFLDCLMKDEPALKNENCFLVDRPEVVGVHMINWCPQEEEEEQEFFHPTSALKPKRKEGKKENLLEYSFSSKRKGRKRSHCTLENDLEAARAICQELSIPFHLVDFSPEYWLHCFQPFLSSTFPPQPFNRQEPAGGFFHTSSKKMGSSSTWSSLSSCRCGNPDVLCNQHIKFDALWKYCRDQLKADYLATGHWAQVLSYGPPGGRDIGITEQRTSSCSTSSSSYFNDCNMYKKESRNECSERNFMKDESSSNSGSHNGIHSSWSWILQPRTTDLNDQSYFLSRVGANSATPNAELLLSDSRRHDQADISSSAEVLNHCVFPLGEWFQCKADVRNFLSKFIEIHDSHRERQPSSPSLSRPSCFANLVNKKSSQGLCFVSSSSSHFGFSAFLKAYTQEEERSEEKEEREEGEKGKDHHDEKLRSTRRKEATMLHWYDSANVELSTTTGVKCFRLFSRLQNNHHHDDDAQTEEKKEEEATNEGEQKTRGRNTVREEGGGSSVMAHLKRLKVRRSPWSPLEYTQMEFFTIGQKVQLEFEVHTPQQKEMRGGNGAAITTSTAVSTFTENFYVFKKDYNQHKICVISGGHVKGDYTTTEPINDESKKSSKRFSKNLGGPFLTNINHSLSFAAADHPLLFSKHCAMRDVYLFPPWKQIFLSTSSSSDEGGESNDFKDYFSMLMMMCSENSNHHSLDDPRYKIVKLLKSHFTSSPWPAAEGSEEGMPDRSFLQIPCFASCRHQGKIQPCLLLLQKDPSADDMHSHHAQGQNNNNHYALGGIYFLNENEASMIWRGSEASLGHEEGSNGEVGKSSHGTEGCWNLGYRAVTTGQAAVFYLPLSYALPMLRRHATSNNLASTTTQQELCRYREQEKEVESFVMNEKSKHGWNQQLLLCMGSGWIVSGNS